MLALLPALRTRYRVRFHLLTHALQRPLRLRQERFPARRARQGRHTRQRRQAFSLRLRVVRLLLALSIRRLARCG